MWVSELFLLLIMCCRLVERLGCPNVIYSRYPIKHLYIKSRTTNLLVQKLYKFHFLKTMLHAQHKLISLNAFSCALLN